MSKLLKLTGLWKNFTKDQKPYLSGKIGDLKIIIFQNGSKTEDRHPDYTLHIDFETFTKNAFDKFVADANLREIDYQNKRNSSGGAVTAPASNSGGNSSDASIADLF